MEVVLSISCGAAQTTAATANFAKENSTSLRTAAAGTADPQPLWGYSSTLMRQVEDPIKWKMLTLGIVGKSKRSLVVVSPATVR